MIRTRSNARLVLVAAALLGTRPGNAQDAVVFGGDAIEIRRVTLEEAIRTVEAKGLELRIARAEVAAADARALAAGRVPNPGVSATREQFTGASTQDETTLLLTQTLEIAGQRGVRRGSASSSARAAAARLAAERQRLVFAVQRAYVLGAVAEADLAILNETAEVFRLVDRAGQARFAEGDISRFERSRLQLERSRYESLLGVAQLRLDEVALDLALLVAADSVSTVTGLLPAEALADLAVSAAPIELDQAIAAAASRAEVEAAEAEVEAARGVLALSLRERIPDLTVSAGVRWVGEGASAAVIGLSLPLPLWDRNRGEIAEARARLDAALAIRDLAVARAATDIRRSWETHRLLLNRADALTGSLDSDSRGILETARIAYAEGEMTLVQLLDAADAYRSARESVNHLLGDYLIAAFDLQRATGSSISPPPTADDPSR